jgi:ubiquinone/menaquinone biosynthesis C-methylase UbiE
VLVLILPFLFLLIGGVIGFSRLRIPRDPDSEQEMDSVEVSRAYDEVSRGRLFRVMRFVIFRELKHCRPDGVTLDIGCGPGYVTQEVARRFPDAKVIGLDISREMLQIAAEHTGNSSRIDFWQADGETLPFKDASVDLVVSTGALHHLRDGKQAFEEVYRVLKPGGEFILLDLRRDTPRFVFYAARLAQRFAMPEGVKSSNGAVGSIRASYTPKELAELVSGVPFYNWIIHSAPAWLTLWAQKEI